MPSLGSSLLAVHAASRKKRRELQGGVQGFCLQLSIFKI